MNARLASLLNRMFRASSTDALPRAAMRIWHPTGGEWSIRDHTLTLQALATPRPDPVRIPLSPPATLASVAAAILAAGWRVDDLPPEMRERGAIALMDQEPTTTGPVLIHNSLLWAIFTGYAAVLDEASAEADALPIQVRTDTATGYWPDYHGEYFGVTRLPGEPDATYAQRIVAEVLRPKSNNLAMAAIISRVTGQRASVIDVTDYGPVVPSYDGSITHNAAYVHDASAKAIKGLFDVVVAFDLLGSTNPATFQADIVAQVERLRAAGTFLRDIALSGGDIPTEAPGPADTGLAALALGFTIPDAAPGPTGEALPVTTNAALADAAAAPADASMPLAAALPELASAATGPSDTALPVTTAATLTDAASAPTEAPGYPWTLGPVLADAAVGPTGEAAAQAGSLANMAEAAAGPFIETLDAPLTLGPVLTDTAAGPTGEAAAQAGSLANMAETAGPSAEVATLTQSWTHVLDGTWTLTGTRPLASTSPLIGNL